MKQGEIARLTIPGELGYGAGGFPAWGYPLLCMCLIPADGTVGMHIYLILTDFQSSNPSKFPFQ